jgi:hypothetical protein
MDPYIIELIDKQKNNLKLLNLSYNKIIKLIEENIETIDSETLSLLQENDSMLSEIINNTEDIIYNNHKINSKSKKDFVNNKKIMEVFYPYIFMMHTMISTDKVDIKKLRTLIGNIMIESSK